MKLSEKKIRKIIRSSLISEMRLGIIGNFEWSDCTEIDLPSGYLGATGDEALKTVEKASALAAQVYGVPGIACDIFNSIFGDNPDKSVKKAEKVIAEVEDLETSIYSSEFEDLKSNPSKFVETMSTESSSPEELHVSIDIEELQDKIKKIEQESEFAQDPIGLVNKVNDIMAVVDRGSTKTVRNLNKNQSIDNNTLVLLIKDQSIKMCKAIAHRNLGQEPIKSSYGSFAEYSYFIQYVTK